MKNLGLLNILLNILLIVFIVLKLIGVIHWGWCWILAPLWVQIILVFIVVLIVWWLK